MLVRVCADACLQVERGGGRTHETDRACTFCGAALLDTIIHFSESYRNDYVPVMALHHAVKADVAIVMGTSMNVQGAASYPVAHACHVCARVRVYVDV